MMVKCKTCGDWCYGLKGNETLLGHQHKCPPVFQVVQHWAQDEPRWQDARDVYAYEAEDAAEKYRDLTDGENCHYPITMVVLVKDKQGTITKWEVEMESRPHYSATEIK